MRTIRLAFIALLAVACGTAKSTVTTTTQVSAPSTSNPVAEDDRVAALELIQQWNAAVAAVGLEADKPGDTWTATTPSPALFNDTGKNHELEVEIGPNGRGMDISVSNGAVQRVRVNVLRSDAERTDVMNAVYAALAVSTSGTNPVDDVSVLPQNTDPCGPQPVTSGPMSFTQLNENNLHQIIATRC